MVSTCGPPDPRSLALYVGAFSLDLVESPFTRGALELCRLFLTQTGTETSRKSVPPPGIEPGTFCLQDRCSATEPQRRCSTNCVNPPISV
uniref:Uncharacterized protein n=1 Tax=Hyaloperonospora arabidopsidis (strain Emoy2) TaxID=559515 RepID=M4BVW7_HYAAE